MDARDFLVSRRRIFGLTQIKVAEAAKISRAHYSNIELGIRRPKPETAQKIAAILKFDWTVFYCSDKEITK